MEKEIREINDRLSNLEKRIVRLEGEKAAQSNSREPGNDSSKAKKISLKEFLLSKKLSNDVQKTLVIAFYLEAHEKYESFNINDLESSFDRAREKKPSNMNDKVNQNIKNGHMDLALEKKAGLKAWHLTNSGEKFVETNLISEKDK